MAVTKILYIGESHPMPGRRLKNAINYITSPDKTQQGRYVSAINCQSGHAYEQMIQTKENFGKTGKRQGYHIIISFSEGEATPEQAFEIIGKFAEEYLGKGYEAVYSVHDDTEHIHGHIVFNSVSFLTGLKYRYEKGDWAKYMQPIVNRLCKEYGFSEIELYKDGVKSDYDSHRWDENHDDKIIWNDMITRDIDICVQEADSFDKFLRLMRERGYEIKQNKYLAVKPQGMKRFRRCYTLGVEYSEENIRERIKYEQIPDMLDDRYAPAQILRVHIPYRLKKAKLSGLQKKYFAKMYRTGRLKKKPYSQAWKYREDIKRFHILQQQYLFLSDYQIQDIDELNKTYRRLKREGKALASQKTGAYRLRAGRKKYFDLLSEADRLKNAKDLYESGDGFFKDEAKRYDEVIREIDKAHYDLEELRKLKADSDERIRSLKEQARENAKKIRTAESLIRELHDEAIRSIDLEQVREKNKEEPDKQHTITQSGEEPETRREDLYGSKSHIR